MGTWGPAELTLVIGAFGAMLVSVIASIGAAVQAARANTISHATDAKADRLIRQSDKIGLDVNGNLSVTTAENVSLREEVKGLRVLVESLAAAKAESDRVAGQLATRVPLAPQPPAGP